MCVCLFVRLSHLAIAIIYLVTTMSVPVCLFICPSFVKATMGWVALKRGTVSPVFTDITDLVVQNIIMVVLLILRELTVNLDGARIH